MTSIIQVGDFVNTPLGTGRLVGVEIREGVTWYNVALPNNDITIISADVTLSSIRDRSELVDYLFSETEPLILALGKAKAECAIAYREFIDSPDSVTLGVLSIAAQVLQVVQEAYSKARERRDYILH